MNRAQAFKIFLKHFSEEGLPITLSDDNIGYFDQKNRPLSSDVIRQFILQSTEDVDEEEYTEYIACNKIPKTKDFHAVIYWRGALLEYDYVLAIYDKNGVLKQRKIIAGVRSDGQRVMKSVATIDEDWIINIAVGAQFTEEYDPKDTKIMSMEIQADGNIISTTDEM